MICALLLYDGTYSTAEESLKYFGERRTDLQIGRAFQGVQTPSQVPHACISVITLTAVQARYVAYVQTILQQFNGSLPPAKTVHLKAIHIRALKGMPIL